MANQQEMNDSPLKGCQISVHSKITKAGKWQLLLAVAVVFLVLAFTTGSAQQITASIHGVVADENKSLVPNAAVIVESSQLALRRTATTSDEGYFTVTNLPVGLYRVTVQ